MASSQKGRPPQAQLSAADEPKPKLACRSAAAVIAFVLISAAGLTADLWSKQHVFDSILSDPSLPARVAGYNQTMRPDTLLNSGYLGLQRPLVAHIKLTLQTNRGVVFGFSMLPPAVVNIVTILTIGLVVLFFAVGEARAWPMHAGLAFILAGALGNLYDRLLSQVRLPGFAEPISNQVRDFIDCSDLHLRVAGLDLYYRWVFNIADVMLVIGVGLLLVNWFIQHRRLRKARAKAAAKPAAKPAE